VYAWWCKCHGHYSAYISKYLILLIFIHSRTPALTGRSLLQENFGTSAGDGAGNPCAGIARVVVLKTENKEMESKEKWKVKRNGKYRNGKYKCEGRGLPGLRNYYYFFLATFFLPAFFFAFFFAAIIVSLKVNLGIV